MKLGYKRTEVGIIPHEWKVSDLQDVCRETITYGIVQCGPHLRDGVPYIRVTDMDKPELDLEQMFRTSPAIASKFARSRVAEGDLVYALRGKIGEVRQVRSNLAGANLTQGTARLSPSDQMTHGYFVWAMRNPRAVRQAETEAKGTTFREITLADLRRIKILVPPLYEQRAIAEALSDVNALLGALDQLIAKKRDLKQAAMQQLLAGKTRLPGFHGEWVVKRLGDVAHIKTGGRNNEDKVADGIYPFFVRSEVVERINSYSHDCEAILVPGEGRIGSIFHYINGKFDAHQRVYTITQFKPDISGKFIHLYLSKNFGAWAMQNTVKATVDSLRLPTFLTFEMKLPSTLDEQIAIAEALSEMDAELAGLEQRREKTRALKQGMMQELLTGRTRLISVGDSHA
jgi:type I restriction enzyme S subunit